MTDEKIVRPHRIAYLTGEYPRATDTFVQREVFGIRARGVDVLTCSVRRTDTAHHVGSEQQAEFQNTFYIFDRVKNPISLVRSHCQSLVASPRRYFSAFRLALKICPPGLRNFLYQMFYFAEAAVLGQYLVEEGVQHLHNHFANSSCSVAMLASEMSGVPFSFTMHGPAIFFEPMKWRIDEKIARASFVSCISHFCRSQAMIFADPVHWDKLHIVHCGVDPSLYESKKPALEKLTDDTTNLLFVGRLAAVKGLPMIFSAVKKLAVQHPNIKLTIIGDGVERNELEARATEAGLKDFIYFAGYKSQTEVAAALQKTDIFVLPSFAEGVPVVLMEALASQVPVVTTQIAGVGELVEDGLSGFTVPPGDVDSLVNRLEELMTNPSLRAKMGAAGRQKVIDDYDIVKESAWLWDLMRAYSTESHSRLGLRPQYK